MPTGFNLLHIEANKKAHAFNFSRCDLPKRADEDDPIERKTEDIKKRLEPLFGEAFIFAMLSDWVSDREKRNRTNGNGIQAGIQRR